jgi:hypothetical protein
LRDVLRMGERGPQTPVHRMAQSFVSFAVAGFIGQLFAGAGSVDTFIDLVVGVCVVGSPGSGCLMPSTFFATAPLPGAKVKAPLGGRRMAKICVVPPKLDVSPTSSAPSSGVRTADVTSS